MKNSKNFPIIVFLSMILVLSSSIIFAFSDVSEDNWAKNAIDSMEKRGILNGYEDGTFKPGNHVTREEFAKILVLSVDLQESSDIVFEDVAKDRWSYEYIDKAGKYFTALVGGGKYYFKPTENALREDIIATSVCALGLQDEKVDLKILDKFKDKDDISPEFKNYIAIAVQKDIIHGDDQGYLNPKGELTRAEVSQFMYNIYERITKGEFKRVLMINEKDNLKKVPSGQAKIFAKNLSKGKEFVLTINDEDINGKMWDDGSIFELYYTMNNKKYTDQINVDKLTKTWTTMLGVEHAKILYGLQTEEVNNKLRFKYTLKDVVYYDDSEIKNNQVETDVFFNFICFILNNDKSVDVLIKDKVEKPVETDTKQDNKNQVEPPKEEQPNTQTEQPNTQTEKPNTQTEKPNTQTEKPNTQTEQPNTQTEQPNSQTEGPQQPTEKLQKVADGQVKTFAKKLEKGKYFEVDINGNKVEGSMWDDGYLFELYPYYDNTNYTEQYYVTDPIDKLKTLNGVEKESIIYGYTVEKTDNGLRLKYKLNDITYYADSKITNNQADGNVVDNFVCFIFNNDKNVKVTILDKVVETPSIPTGSNEPNEPSNSTEPTVPSNPTVPTEPTQPTQPEVEQEVLEAVESGQVKLFFTKKLKRSSDFDIKLTLNGKEIKGHYFASATWPTNSPYFELYPIINDKQTIQRFILNNNNLGHDKMPYLNEHAELYGFTTEKINNTIRLKYKVNGVVYYSDMPPVDGHYNLNIYTNFIAFVLCNTKDLKVETFPSQFDFIVYPD